jgi:hypothetical protein
MERVKNIGKSVLIKVVIIGIGLFYTWIMSIVVAFKWIIKGKSFWHVEERSLPPLVLQDPSLGRHSYVSLKVYIILKCFIFLNTEKLIYFRM